MENIKFNRKFNIDVEKLLGALRKETGKDIFKNIKKRGSQYQCSCPFHEDKKPSFGINEDGIWHCFSCQEKGNVVQLVQKILDLDNYRVAEDWIKNRFNNYVLETTEIPSINFTLPSVKTIDGDHEAIYISEKELKRYRVKHPYMYERKLTDDIIAKFDVGFDKDFSLGPAITFPIRDINGNVVNIARRCVNSKIFHYPSNSYKPVYGLFELFKYKQNTKTLWICESILDALYLWTLDIPAVALNGLGSREQLKQLEVLGIYDMVLATDNDSSGTIARENIRNKIKGVRFKDAILPKGRKDINECTEEEIRNMELSINQF